MSVTNNISFDINQSDGIVTFKNVNTTPGFVRYNEESQIEYIFVNPMFRRQGLAKKLLNIVEKKIKLKLHQKLQ
jgi:ribosomal protein S18 acetylase RimI-like enzyme